MKLKLWQKIALSALLVTSIGVGLGGSLAWFDTHIKLDPQTSFEGVSEGAYFAYGNGKPRQSGSKDEPYGIATPRHLYNLAWLQYLGLIDDVFNQNPATSEACFELANDIDMTGWSLPPIGTTTNPFMGHFNGNGYTIKGLTVTNDENDFLSGSSKKPERASGYSSDIPHIVGLFGVVGPYYGSELAYSSETDAITNLNVSGITVKSKVDNGVLAGLVAGYVNGPVSSVAISDAVTDSGTTKSTLNLHAANGTGTASAYAAGKNVDGSSFSKISEFGTVGYAETAYTSKAKKTTSTLYGYNSEKDAEFTGGAGDKEGFGGSIDMKTMYQGVRAVWDTYSDSSDGIPSYPTKRTVVYDKNGSIVSTDYSDYTKVPTFRSGTGTYRYYQAEQKDGDKVTSSYTFAHRENLDYYMYLYGDTTTQVANALTTVSLRQTEGTVITISKEVGGTTYYLRYNNGITYTTAEGQATEFVFKDGKIFYPDNSGSATNTFYLYKSGSALGTNGSGSTFIYDSANKSYYVTQSSVRYYLSFDSDARSWVFVNDYKANYIHSGDHYLTAASWANNAGVADTTLSKSPSWTIPANGSSGSISHQEGGTTFYLRLNNGNLSVTTNSYNATNWTVSSTGTAISSGSNYLGYQNGAWTTVNTDVQKYKISDGEGHYLSANGSTLTNTNEADATEWYKDSGSETYYFLGSNNTKYYIIQQQQRPYYSLSNNGTKFQRTGGYFKSTYTTGFIWTTRHYLYVKYDGGNWTVTHTEGDDTGNGTKLTLHQISVSPLAVSITRDYDVFCDKNTISTTVGDTYNTKTTTTEDSAWTTKPTYFPLRQEQTNNLPNGIPQQTNTGYVTSGANERTGDVRVSDYPSSLGSYEYIGDFFDRYGSNGIRTVYSRDDNGDKLIYNTVSSEVGGIVDLSSNYEKFSDTRTSLQSVFQNDPNNIYGLHFVGATVQYSGGTGEYAGNSVYAEKAIVNKETHSNYELPKDCIDFNLKEKGYVNFIAGTYFSEDDNCFFSLHDIGRNADESINYIKEIVEIYESKSTPATATEYKTYSYQYKYGDGTYSVPFKYIAGEKVKLDGTAYTENQFLNSLDSTNYNSTPKFKTAWIKENTLKISYCYYFEIPINSGEYCLSSVKNTYGAYLMYLDIGANAAKKNRTTLAEYITEVTETWKYPKGLALVATGTTPASVDAYNSYCIVIDDTYGGTVTLSRESETAGTVTYSDTTNKLKMGFFNDGIAVSGVTDQIAPEETKTDEIRRITFFDYSVADGALYKLVVTRRNAENPTLERFLWNSTTSKWQTASAEQAVLYNKEGATITDVNGMIGLYTEATMAAKFAQMKSSGTAVLGFRTMYYGTGALAISYALNGAMQQAVDGQFFIVSGYDIDMTYTDASAVPAKVTVLSAVTTYNELQITFVIEGTTVTGANQKITIPLS